MRIATTTTTMENENGAQETNTPITPQTAIQLPPPAAQPLVFGSTAAAPVASSSRGRGAVRETNHLHHQQNHPASFDYWWLQRRHHQYDSDDEDICELNSIDEDCMNIRKANELEANRWYSAEIIKKVRTEFGVAHVITSENFKFYLPRRYANLNREIKPFLRNRQFMIKGFYKRGNDTTPILTFRKG